MYKPVNGWTKKRILEVVDARLFEEAAYDNRFGVCRYLLPNGNKCAIGLFIPEGHPAQNSSLGLTALKDRYPELMYKIPLDIAGMVDLQRLHDDPYNKENAKTKIREWVEKNVEGL